MDARVVLAGSVLQVQGIKSVRGEVYGLQSFARLEHGEDTKVLSRNVIRTCQSRLRHNDHKLPFYLSKGWSICTFLKRSLWLMAVVDHGFAPIDHGSFLTCQQCTPFIHNVIYESGPRLSLST